MLAAQRRRVEKRSFVDVQTRDVSQDKASKEVVELSVFGGFDICTLFDTTHCLVPSAHLLSRDLGLRGCGALRDAFRWWGRFERFAVFELCFGNRVEVDALCVFEFSSVGDEAVITKAVDEAKG